MAVITFKNYRVLEMNYSVNPDYVDEGKTVSYRPEFNMEFNKDSDKKAKVILGTSYSGEFPFDIKVNIEGTFVFEKDQDTDDLGFDHFLKTNAVAILFPYLRSLVSQLTLVSNQFPALILPTVNVPRLIEMQDKENKQD